MIFLDEVAYPVFVPQNEGMLRPVKVDRAEGLDLQPQLPARVLRALLPGAARRRPRAAGAGAGGAGARSPPATRRTCTSSPTPASTPRRASTGSTSRSTRAPTAAATARRPGLRRLPDRQHAQQPDRGARVALPDADGALRAARRAMRGGRVARRHRHGARQPLPGRHDRHLRGRAPRGRPAVGHLRRPRGPERVDDARTPGTPAEESLAVEDHGLRASRPATRSRSRVPNSGGYGDPLERDPERVLDDVLDGFTTRRARRARLRRRDRRRPR